MRTRGVAFGPGVGVAYATNFSFHVAQQRRSRRIATDAQCGGTTDRNRISVSSAYSMQPIPPKSRGEYCRASNNNCAPGLDNWSRREISIGEFHQSEIFEHRTIARAARGLVNNDGRCRKRLLGTHRRREQEQTNQRNEVVRAS